MPSKSRKKIKGQARKAKAEAAITCNHGYLQSTPALCNHFMTTFFQSYTTIGKEGKMTIVRGAFLALKDAYTKWPEAINNETYLDFTKKIILNRITMFLLRNEKVSFDLARGFSAALMVIDSYNPSSFVPAGLMDERDASKWLTNVDILGGCQRSLVKFIANQIPCKCLDELYSQLQSTTPKMGICFNCHQRKKRSSMYICTGCERMQYCSKACQLAHVPIHKESCKIWQSGGYSPTHARYYG